MLNRRDLIKTGLGVGAGVALGRWGRWGSASAFYQSPTTIPLFGTRAARRRPGRDSGRGAGRFRGPGHRGDPLHDQHQTVPGRAGICPTLGPTTLWGYDPAIPLGGGTQPQKHLGGIIVGQKGQPIQINFQNQLFVNKHILPVDMTIPGASLGINRTAVHLHGGLVPWISDGGPFDWFDPTGRHGLSFLNNQTLNPLALPGSAEYYYPLNQSARFMWYHDHAVGITRLNAYAGMATGLIVRDTFEAGLIDQGPAQLRRGRGERDSARHSGEDLRRPEGSPDRPDVAGSNGARQPLVRPRLRSEPVGPGKKGPPVPGIHRRSPSSSATRCSSMEPSFPQATVQARRYRLRLLNATNARFLNLQLYIDDGSLNGITLDGAGKPTNTAFINAATGDCVLPPDRHRRGLPLEAGEGPVQPAATVPATSAEPGSGNRPDRPVARFSSRWSWRRQSGPTSSSTSVTSHPGPTSSSTTTRPHLSRVATT